MWKFQRLSGKMRNICHPELRRRGGRGWGVGRGLGLQRNAFHEAIKRKADVGNLMLARSLS